MTKKQRGMYENYLRATKTSLYECYEKPSRAKVLAFESCKRRMYERAENEDINIFGPFICSYNTMMFTFAYEYETIQGESWLHYETNYNIYDFKVK